MARKQRYISAFLSATAIALVMTGCATAAPQRPVAKIDPMLEGVPEGPGNIFPNANELCGPITGGAKNPAIEAHILRFRYLLSKSETGAAMLKRAETYPDKDKARPLWICFEKMTDKNPPYAYYSWGRGVLVINTELYDYPIPEGKQIAAAVHELRHSEQDVQEMTDLQYKNKDEAQVATYASEADAESIGLLVQWEMKEAGYSVPWAIRSNPENFRQGYFCFANMYSSFETTIKNGGSKADATRASFRQWHNYKPMLQSYQGQGNMRWGLQEAHKELIIKWKKEDEQRAAEKARRKKNMQGTFAIGIGPLFNAMGLDPDYTPPRLAPRPPDGELISHTWQTCGLPRTEIELELPQIIPDEEFSKKLDFLGELPDGSGNYLKSGGGVRKILSEPVNTREP